MKSLRLTFGLLLASCLSPLFAQQNTAKGFMVTQDIFGCRVFIENHGQFDHESQNGEKIKYALDNGLEKIFFTEQGLIYKLSKSAPLRERDLEAMENGKPFDGPKTKTNWVYVHWHQQPVPMTIETKQKQGYYFTYGDASMNASAYKTIVYRGVYPGIDLEFTIPQNKDHGIKYSFVVHPGANPELINVLYSGDVNSLKVDKSGNIRIATDINDIIEHAPLSFQGASENNVSSAYTLEDKRLGFVFPQGYDKSKTLIIDPWVTTIVSLTTNQFAYDVDYDYYNNTYVYGGYNPYKVARYDATGTLQWVFGGLVSTTTPTWSSAPIIGQASNFAVNRYNRKTYIGQGFVNSGNRVIRLNSNGNYDNFVNSATGQFQEVWDMGFHCTTGNVFVLGGGTSGNNSAATLDSVTAAITLSTFQPTVLSSAQDVASHAIDDLGNIFVIYAGNLNNKICRVNSTFNGNVWTQPSNYGVFSEQGNKNQYAFGPPNLSSNGFNCLAVNNNYLYYYNGLDIAVYNKNTGLQISSTTSGLLLKKQGGIAVDDCDNVYVGGNGSILSFHFNGTSFSTLTSIPLAVTNVTSTYVYDIKLNKQSKILYVSGSGFVGNYSASNSQACVTATSACFGASVPQNTDQSACFGRSTMLVVQNGSNLLNPTYSIQPGGFSNNTGSFVVTPSASVVYTTFVTGVNTSSAVVTQSALATVSIFPVPLATGTTTQSTCTSTVNALQFNVSFTPAVTGTNIPNYNINWSPLPTGITNNTQTSVSGGIAPGFYTAAVMASNGCSTAVVFTINPLPEPATFSVSPGGAYLVNCFNPTLTLQYLPPSLNYTTYNGLHAPQTGPSPVFTSTNAVGVYTANAVHPISGCVYSRTFAVQSNTTPPLAVVSPTFQNITCGVPSVNNITITATSPTVNVSHIVLSPIGGSLISNGYNMVYVPGIPGAHTVITVNDANGCTSVKTFSIASNTGFPTFSVVSISNFTLGCSSKSMALVNIVNGQSTNSLQIPVGGAVSYTAIGPPTSTVVPSGTLSNVSSFSITVPGTWTLITKDNQSLCETRLPISIINNTVTPKLDTLLFDRDILNCNTPTVTLKAISSTPNIGFVWSYDSNTGNVSASSISVSAIFSVAPTTTLVDNYTLTITDNNNLCLTKTVVPIYQNLFPPKAKISNGGVSALTCLTTTLMLTNSSESTIPPNHPKFTSGAPVIGFLWKGPSPQVDQNFASTYVGQVPGTYTMIAKDLGNGCTSQTVISVADNAEYPVVNNPVAAPVFSLDCGKGTTIKPLYSGPTNNYVYSWVPSGDFPTGPKNLDTLFTENPGEFVLFVTNTLTGCMTITDMKAIAINTLHTEFTPDFEQGFAPLQVNFSNQSRSASGSGSITSVWNFGNGASATYSSVATASAVFNQPGTYTVTLYTAKGNCLGTSQRVIQVDIPSDLMIPNIFTPNADGVNDFFFLKASGLAEISIVIYSRWGQKVYELSTTVGNISWDGKNQFGKDVAEGVYYYVIKATGKDGKSYERKGNVTLAR